LNADTRAISKAFGRIPYATETGNYFGGEGISNARTGNFTCQGQNLRRMRFSLHTGMLDPSQGRARTGNGLFV
jgi:hypothetical protein